MMFKLSFTTVIFAVATLFATANALADNDVDACNGSNDYGVGHDCAFSGGSGTVEGTCQNNACGNLICKPN
ncbi:unnamed protein product [Peniophora sp. CBMAI 1063]|nr:unnamed protein product [Peniophora sp. CBMAI 1063]